jgi:hypothetical protein
MKNKGLHTHRFRENPDEKRFAEEWERQNVQARTLNYLLGDGLKPVDATPREREVAATLIQWLGSEVGKGFLEDVGYVKKVGSKYELES